MTGFDYLKNFLQEEGFHFQDEEGYISFKFEMTTFIAFKNDSPYVQIVVVCNAEGYDRTKVLDVCNRMNQEKFVLKFVVQGETVWCSYEFMPSEHTTASDFGMFLSLLNRASDELLGRLAQ